MAAGVAHTLHARVVARSENLRGQILMGGDNVSTLVKIRLTDLPKTGGGCLSPPSPPLATALHYDEKSSDGHHAIRARTPPT